MSWSENAKRQIAEQVASDTREGRTADRAVRELAQRFLAGLRDRDLGTAKSPPRA